MVAVTLTPAGLNFTRDIARTAAGKGKKISPYYAKILNGDNPTLWARVDQLSLEKVKETEQRNKMIFGGLAVLGIIYLLTRKRN